MTTEQKKGVVLLQLGSPKSPAVEDVRSFLEKFLGDPRVVDSKSIMWKIVLKCFILPTRPKVVSEAYASIWKDGQFPLFRYTEAYVEALNHYLAEKGHDHIFVHQAYIVSEPSIKDAVEHLKSQGCESIRIIYQFPQYCEATTLSARDAVEHNLGDLKARPEIELLETFHRNPSYIESLAFRIDEHLREHPSDKLILSFHGYPLRRVFAGDDYFDHCVETAQMVAERLKSIDTSQVIISFQSKFGREEWLTPSTEDMVKSLAEQGVKRLAIACPAFTVDNLETDEEINIGIRELFLEEGGESFTTVPCLNAHPKWVESSAEELILKEKSEVTEIKEINPILEVPKQAYKVEPLTPEAKTSLKGMFILLLLDLIGFSIIFPLFPKILEYYQGVESNHGLFAWSMSQIENIKSLIGGSGSTYDIVIFGGILGSVYSAMQFVFAPIFGSLSDRFGRRPVLLVAIFGIAISYGMWFFAGSFAMLVASRLFGGIMSGNISTASAVVADVTNQSNRSKGMATIGIAFGLGFIIGPAIGALFTKIDLLAWYPGLEVYGVTPFSMPAFFAFSLAVVNFVFVFRKFKETHPKEKRGQQKVSRSINPLVLFRVEKYPGVSLNNFIYFLFLLAFSGMEFTLVFLTAERFAYGNISQGLMFTFIGVVLALVQGGYVRRKASEVGEKKMSARGMFMVLIGLVIIGLAPHSAVLFLGLTFLAIGSAQAMPCLTSLASIYTPDEEQGRILGVFRSLGALARVFGPFTAGFLYWKLGGGHFYVLGGLFILLPFFLMRSLPPFPKVTKEAV